MNHTAQLKASSGDTKAVPLARFTRQKTLAKVSPNNSKAREIIHPGSGALCFHMLSALDLCMCLNTSAYTYIYIYVCVCVFICSLGDHVVSQQECSSPLTRSEGAKILKLPEPPCLLFQRSSRYLCHVRNNVILSSAKHTLNATDATDATGLHTSSLI